MFQLVLSTQGLIDVYVNNAINNNREWIKYCNNNNYYNDNNRQIDYRDNYEQLRLISKSPEVEDRVAVDRDDFNM